MKKIYTFGDSHTSMFHLTYPRIKGVEPVASDKVQFFDRADGVPTAFSLNNHDENIHRILNLIDFEEQDEMWFHFGEIDVRFHIFFRHQEDEITVDESIDRVVKAYIDYVVKLRSEGYPICIMSVVPTQPNDSPYRWDPTYEVKAGVRGDGITLKDRVYMTEMMNYKLDVLCYENAIPFINIYPLLVDMDTRTNKIDWTRDGMHYNYVGDLIIDYLKLEEGVT